MSKDALFAEVYAHLRALAGTYFRRQRRDHTLTPTALVHEAFLRMAHTDLPDDRTHFLAVAATAMRHILIDRARQVRTSKRGGHARRVTLASLVADKQPQPYDVLALDEALRKLAELDARHARLVELRVFGGLTEEEAAAVLAVSLRTVQKDWRAAKAWLVRELQLAPPSS